MNACTDQGRIQIVVAGASPEDGDREALRRADVCEGFAEVLGASAVATCRYEQTARQILRDRPELALVVGSCMADRCDYARVRKACDEADARLAFWLQNDPHEFDACVKACGLADFMFSNDLFASMHYPHPRTFHLPPAASPRRCGQLAQCRGTIARPTSCSAAWPLPTDRPWSRTLLRPSTSGGAKSVDQAGICKNSRSVAIARSRRPISRRHTRKRASCWA